MIHKKTTIERRLENAFYTDETTVKRFKAVCAALHDRIKEAGPDTGPYMADGEEVFCRLWLCEGNKLLGADDKKLRFFINLVKASSSDLSPPKGLQYPV